MIHETFKVVSDLPRRIYPCFTTSNPRRRRENPRRARAQNGEIGKTNIEKMMVKEITIKKAKVNKTQVTMVQAQQNTTGPIPASFLALVT
jgi:hypothetical protein